jgi:excisionase family DNA binding protein
LVWGGTVQRENRATKFERPKMKTESANTFGGQPRGAFKLKDAAIYLAVSQPTIHRLIHRGLLRPNRATRHLIFPIAELDRFLSEG